MISDDTSGDKVIGGDDTFSVMNDNNWGDDEDLANIAETSENYLAKHEERHHQLKLLVVIINVIINSLWYMSIPVKIFIFWSWTCLRVFLFFQLS